MEGSLGTLEIFIMIQYCNNRRILKNKKVTLLRMFNIGRGDVLEVTRRWRTDNSNLSNVYYKFVVVESL